MMWLMYRPTTAQRNAAGSSAEYKDKDSEPIRFNERELVLLAELLQARSAVQQKTMDAVTTANLEERAA